MRTRRQPGGFGYWWVQRPGRCKLPLHTQHKCSDLSKDVEALLKPLADPGWAGLGVAVPQPHAMPSPMRSPRRMQDPQPDE